MLKQLGMSVAKNCAIIMLGIVINRVRRAEQASTELQEETRHKRAIAKRKLEEEFQAAED